MYKPHRSWGPPLLIAGLNVEVVRAHCVANDQWHWELALENLLACMLVEKEAKLQK